MSEHVCVTLVPENEEGKRGVTSGTRAHALAPSARHEADLFGALPDAREDPLHRPIVDDFRARHGLPAGGRDELGQPLGPSDAEIKYRLGGPSLPSIFHLSFALGAIPGSPDHSLDRPGPPGGIANLAGYTRVTLGGKMGVTWGRNPPVGGQVRMFLSSVDVTYQLDPIVVQVSSRYAERSCPYRVTLAHEMDHVGSFVQLFGSGERSLRSELAGVSVPLASAPVSVPSAKAADREAFVEQQLMKVIAAHRATLRARMESDRDQKDAPASYVRVYAQCPRGEW